MILRACIRIQTVSFFLPYTFKAACGTVHHQEREKNKWNFFNAKMSRLFLPPSTAAMTLPRQLCYFYDVILVNAVNCNIGSEMDPFTFPSDQFCRALIKPTKQVSPTRGNEPLSKGKPTKTTNTTFLLLNLLHSPSVAMAVMCFTVLMKHNKHNSGRRYKCHSEPEHRALTARNNRMKICYFLHAELIFFN